MKEMKEIVKVGSNYYVIGDRVSRLPPMRKITEQKVIDLMRKEGRTPYATPEVEPGREFAEGPFESFEKAKSFVESNGFSLRV